MAMSFPSADSPQQQGNNNSDTTSATSNNNSNGIITPQATSSTTPMNDQATGQNQSAPTNGAKRKPSRRANTAERRATHNAVERQRRETLNGRFLDLAGLLPNLSQIRRPSKSSIVNSSIAHIQASRRHRMVASRELRILKTESDALRRELNEWRDRAGLPRVEEPVRGDGFGMVLAGELEVISGISIEEEDDDADDGFGVGLAMGGIPHHPAQQQHHQQMPSYHGPYMDDGDDDVTLLGPIYPQQPQQATGIHQPHHHHTMHHAPQHQMHHQQQQQHAMMAHDLEDPCVAAMLMKNAATANPFAHTISPSAGSPSGYPAVGTRSAYSTNNNTSWVTSPATYGAQTHLYTPPATSHGPPTPTVTAGSHSNPGSPIDGVSVNGITNGSPVSTSSSLSSLSGGGGRASPLGTTHGHMGNRTRERSGSGSLSTSGNSSGGQSPAYELHHAQVHPTMQEYGVSRMVGMGPSAPFVPSHHHHVHGGHGMPVGVGGGVNGAMMMMMM
jgi:hypothetical protein